MAETKAEDDDDESFGDFTFASFPNQSVHTTGNNNADDDEWGDFVESPLGSELPTVPSYTQSQSSQPLDFFSDHSTEPSLVHHSGVELGNNQRIKPKGTLPLSLFGDEEEEEESRVVNPSVGDLKEPFANKHSGNVETLSNFQSGAGIDDFIANLYGESKRIKPESGFISNLADSNLNLDGKNLDQSAVKLNKNASLSTPNHVRSHSDLAGTGKSDIFTNLYNQSVNMTTENGFISSSNKLGWNSFASSPNLQGLNSNLQALHSNGSSTNMESLKFNDLSSNLKGLNSNGPSSHLQELNSKASSSDMKGPNSNGSISNMQGLNANEWSSNMRGLDFNGSSLNLQGLNANRSSSNLQELNANGSSSNLQGLNPNGSSSNLQGMNANGSSSNLQGLDPNGSSSNLQGLNSNGSSSNLRRLNSSFKRWNLNSGSMGRNEEHEAARYSESKVGITAENGFSSDSKKLDSISNASNSNPSHLDWNLNGLNSNSGTFGGKEEIGNDDDDDDDGWEFKVAYSEAKIGDGITTESGFASNSNNLDVNSNGLSSNSRSLDSSFNVSNLNSESIRGNEKFDADDDGWGFKDAYSESKIINGNDKGPVAFELSGPQLESKWEIGREMQKEHVIFEVTLSSGLGNDVGGPIDLFSDSNAVSSEPHEDTRCNFKLSKVAENGSLSYSYFQSDQSGIENRLDSHPPVQHADSDESFGDFTAAFSETESKHNEEPNISDLSRSEVQVVAIDGKNKVNENHKGPVPLSIFGDEELETNGSSSVQDDLMFKPPVSSSHRRAQSQGSSLSLNDLFELYSQAAPIHSVDDSLQKNTENGLDSTDEVLNSNLMDIGNDLEEDGSWEFKDAVSPITKDHTNISIETKMNNYADFYCKLKEELCSVARHHLDGLKKAQSSATLSGEDAKVSAIDEEIQEACEELYQENIICEEANPEDHQPRDMSLKEFLEVLNEPEFQVLESEYNLSRRLSMAEEDLRTAVELIKHATAMLKIFKLVSLEEQSTYVSIWSKMLSISAQELKHGASIWKQSLEKNVHIRIISEPQGKRFIIGLGEIFRAVAILGVSVKLYRPWIVSNSTSICSLLEECRNLWSSSGLEETLPTISNPLGFEYNGSPNALSESIKQIDGLDAFALGNCVFGQQDSVCRLSLLPTGVVPGMNMVVWDGEYYFVTLANLWANLINNDPPKLLCLKQFG